MRRGHSLDSVLTLVLFCLFTGSVLLVLMMGIQSYQKVVTSMEESYQERTYLQYIATKVRHYSGTDAVTITEFGDGDALALHETFYGEEYITYLYVYEGMAMELFCASDVQLAPDDGFSIMEISQLQLEMVYPDLLWISCVGNGGSASLHVGLYGEEEGAL